MSAEPGRVVPYRHQPRRRILRSSDPLIERLACRFVLRVSKPGRLVLPPMRRYRAAENAQSVIVGSPDKLPQSVQ